MIRRWSGAFALVSLAIGLTSCTARPLDGEAPRLTSDGGHDGGTVDADLRPTRGTFAPQYVVPTLNNFTPTFRLADLNTDGVLDIVVGGATGLAWLRGVGDGSFGAAQSLATDPYVRDLQVVDLDRDGDLDIVAARPDSYLGPQLMGDVLVLLREGGTMIKRAWPGGNRPLSIATADVDHDDVLDVWIVRSDGLSILRGTGDGQLSPPTTEISPGPTSATLAVSDFRRSGHADAITGVQNALRWYRGSDGGLGVQTIPSLTFDEQHGFAVVAESELYLISSTSGPRNVFRLDLASGQAPVRVVSTDTGRALAVDDLDGDGLRDIVHTVFYKDSSTVIHVLYGTGPDSFEPPIVLSGFPAVSNVGQLVVADLDHDGRKDLLAGDYQTGQISVFLQR